MTLNHKSDCAGECSACPAVGSCPDRVVCRCLSITEESVINAIRTNGVRNLFELKQVTEAGTGCTCCHRELHAYLAVYAPREEAALSMV